MAGIKGSLPKPIEAGRTGRRSLLRAQGPGAGPRLDAGQVFGPRQFHPHRLPASNGDLIGEAMEPFPGPVGLRAP